MKTHKLKIISAVMAAVLVLCSVPAAFAGSAAVSKGAAVISAVAGGAGESSDSETEGSSQAVTPETSSDTDSAQISESDDPDIVLGDQFSDSMSDAEEQALDSIEYSLDEYENNEVLVMYNDGSFEIKSYDSQEELAAGLEALDADESVDTYQPNFSYDNEATTQNTITDDTYSIEQWALSNDGSFEGYRTSVQAESGVDVSAEKAWQYYTPARDVVVALIDTGVQYQHPELSGSFWTNSDEIAGNGIDDDNNGYVDDVNGWNFYDNNNCVYTGSDDAHGTHCAGTISAKKDNSEGISGLADYDNIKIMMLKALGGQNGEGTTLSLALAIKYAEKNGASICNLSLGTDQNDKILYQTMKNSSMLFVVAAGNGGSDGRGTDIDKSPSYPASYNLDNIITVANVKADGNLNTSSDYGAASVDIGAPGTDIISTASDGKYAYMTGTSMAAPFVTASAAMVYSSNASLTLADTKNILLSTVKSDTALAGKTVSGGILDCGSAVAYAVTGSTQRETDEDIEAQPSQEENTSDISAPAGSSTPQKQYDFTENPFGWGNNASDPFSSGFGGDIFDRISMPSINLGDFFGFDFKINIPQFMKFWF